MTRLQRTPAISLRAYDYSETSQVLHLYTRDHGKVHCIAKGAKRKKSAFHGPFDVMTLYEVIRLEKQPGALDILTAAEALHDWRGLRRDFGRFAVASYACEALDTATLEGQPQPELFELLKSTLDRLEAQKPLADCVFLFEMGLLRELGQAPRLDACGSCRRPLAGPEAYFSARDGGAVCVRCKPRDPTRILFKRPVFDALAAFGEGRVPNLSILPDFVPQLRRAADYYVCHVLEREPQAMRFMRDAVMGRTRGSSDKGPQS